MNLVFANWETRFLNKEEKYIFDIPTKFLLKPDNVLKIDDRVVILDTKWKRYNGCPAQVDAYQMLAYSKRYGCKRVYLVYPSAESETKISEQLVSRDVELFTVQINLKHFIKPVEAISKFEHELDEIFKGIAC